MWPYACLSDCKVMVKCVESDGKVIATHVSVQSHCQPVRPDRERVAVTHHVSHACDTASFSVLWDRAKEPKPTVMAQRKKGMWQHGNTAHH